MADLAPRAASSSAATTQGVRGQEGSNGSRSGGGDVDAVLPFQDRVESVGIRARVVAEHSFRVVVRELKSARSSRTIALPAVAVTALRSIGFDSSRRGLRPADIGKTAALCSPAPSARRSSRET
jgi:hypothetical protein